MGPCLLRAKSRTMWGAGCLDGKTKYSRPWEREIQCHPRNPGGTRAGRTSNQHVQPSGTRLTEGTSNSVTAPWQKLGFSSSLQIIREVKVWTCYMSRSWERWRMTAYSQLLDVSPLRNPLNTSFPRQERRGGCRRCSWGSQHTTAGQTAIMSTVAWEMHLFL